MKELLKKMFKKMGDELFTIPNMLSIFRLLLIPIIVYVYCIKHDNLWTFILVAISSITDIADGFIARRFNMITDFGKFLDPLADKATQVCIFACLATKFPLMWVPFIIMIIKELGSLALRVVVYKETDLVDGAKWHGKAATTLVISVVVLHLIWPTIPMAVSTTLVVITTAFLLYSGILYTIEAFKMLKTHEKQI